MVYHYNTDYYLTLLKSQHQFLLVENPFLKPGESTFVTMTIDSKGLTGQVVKSVSIKVKNQEGELRLIVTSEIIPQ